jgi:hypothetical protein
MNRTLLTIAGPRIRQKKEIDNMKIFASMVALCLVIAAASAQSVPTQDPLLSENTVKVSDHVWAIMGWPNIGIVVGENATLVVDTGLGPRNGATAARVAKRLAPNNKIQWRRDGAAALVRRCPYQRR